MSDLLDGAAAAITDDATPAPEWQTAKNGRQFVRDPTLGQGYAGMVWRAGDETVTEAIARRRAGPRDKPPRSRKTRKLEDRPPVDSLASKSEVTRQIAEMMTDILSAPSMPCAMFGMDWEANHFDRQGAVFAQNIARSSERNPWLRRKLESALQGEQSVIAWITSMNLATGAIGYVVPPLIKWGIVPAPDTTRMLFGLPPVGRMPPQRQQYQSPPMVDHLQNVTKLFQDMNEAAATDGPANMTDAQPSEPQSVS